jgi:MurNAc alpha-1-phosphate uridylyltransferase
MKAMLLAAGIGSRLGKLTEKTPKSLIEVGGKTMLDHVITRLKDAGVDGIMINLFHLGDKIENYVASKKSYSIDIRYSKEDELLGTGGGLKKAASFFENEESFYIYNCDIYCELDLKKVYEFHKASPAAATLVTMKRESSRQLYFDKGGNLAGWINKDSKSGEFDPITHTKLAFSGIHLATPKIFNYMKNENGNFSIITSYLNAVAAGDRIQNYTITDEYWIDMGKEDSLKELKARLSA